MTWNYFKLSAYSMHQIEGWRSVFYDVLFYCNNLTHWIKLWWQLFCIFDKRKHWTLFGLWILVQLNLLFGDCVLCWMFGDKKLPAFCKCNNWVVISTHHFTSLKMNNCPQENVRPKRNCPLQILVHFLWPYLVVWSVLLRVLEISFWLDG